MRGTMCLQLTGEKWTIKRVIRDHVYLLHLTAGSYLVLVPLLVQLTYVCTSSPFRERLSPYSLEKSTHVLRRYFHTPLYRPTFQIEKKVSITKNKRKGLINNSCYYLETSAVDHFKEEF